MVQNGWRSKDDGYRLRDNFAADRILVMVPVKVKREAGSGVWLYTPPTATEINEEIAKQVEGL